MLTSNEHAQLARIERDTIAWATFHGDIVWLLALVRRLDSECEQLRAELAADADLLAGRFETFDTMDDMIADLNRKG
jgi:hypothetical protein